MRLQIKMHYIPDHILRNDGFSCNYILIKTKVGVVVGLRSTTAIFQFSLNFSSLSRPKAKPFEMRRCDLW